MLWRRRVRANHTGEITFDPFVNHHDHVDKFLERRMRYEKLLRQKLFFEKLRNYFHRELFGVVDTSFLNQ